MGYALIKPHIACRIKNFYKKAFLLCKKKPWSFFSNYQIEHGAWGSVLKSQAGALFCKNLYKNACRKMGQLPRK